MELQASRLRSCPDEHRTAPHALAKSRKAWGTVGYFVTARACAFTLGNRLASLCRSRLYLNHVAADNRFLFLPSQSPDTVLASPRTAVAPVNNMADLTAPADPAALNGFFPAEDAAGQTVAAIAESEKISAGNTAVATARLPRSLVLQTRSRSTTDRFDSGASRRKRRSAPPTSSSSPSRRSPTRLPRTLCSPALAPSHSPTTRT